MKRGNFCFAHHWTETDSNVLEFLTTYFHAQPQVSSGRGDVQVGGYDVEIKSCREWIRAKCSNGSRRRGHFYFGGHERADYILFVLVREDGSLSYRIDDAKSYPLSDAFKVNHSKIFGDHNHG